MAKKITRLNKDSLYWNFDVSAFRLLGRELITDRITALFEIVKNSYDANAENVTIEFHHVNPISNKSKIIISDDGKGMTYDDLKNKWMVIGTSSKRENPYSPEPYRRRVAGKKGIGRFAVDKLGSTVILESKTKTSQTSVILETDWSKYEKLENQQLKSPKNKQYFTEVDNKCWTKTSKTNKHGTKIEITNLNDIWTERDIQKAYSELSKLVSPIKNFSYPFNIVISATEYDQFQYKLVENNSIAFATEEIDLTYDPELKKQETLFFSKKQGKLLKRNVPYGAMGPVNLKLFYFDQIAKKQFQNSYAGAIIDGVKIYRDGLITTPFAEYAIERHKERDILGIDKRRWSGFFEKINSRDLLGFVDISDEQNPQVIEATNRQDFVDNDAYRELRVFIIDQIEALEEYISYKKLIAREESKSQLLNAHQDLQSTNLIIKEIKKIATPEVKQKLKAIEKNVRDVEIQIKRGIQDYNELEKEQQKQQNFYMSLMSLQDYATELSHVVRIALNNISNEAQFIKDEYPNPAYENEFLLYAANIYNEINKLSTAVEFMLSYAKSNIGFTEFDLRALIENLFKKTYRSRFEKESIKIILDLEGTIIVNHNIKFFEDIFENLISNSIKFLEGRKNKIIKCSASLIENNFVIYFSDNGPGVLPNIKKRIFNIYFSTTEAKGGAGIGLYIVKKRIEALKGEVSLVENEFKPTGASFKIVLPLNKDNNV